MPHARTDDGVDLYYECSAEGDPPGTAPPIVFVHEFAGDARSWEGQVRHLARRYRCITYNARGYPPSEVPPAVERYSQERAWRDIAAVLDALDVDRAHVVGLSMGGFAALHFGLNLPERAASLVIAGCGYGAEPDRREGFRDEAEATACLIERDGMEAFAATYALGPARVQFQNKDPRGWTEFRDQLAGHSAAGSACTMRGVQRERPSLYGLEARLRALDVPTLIVTGDEDEPCLEPNVYLKRTLPRAGLVVVPNTGHTVNLEEPGLFNRLLDDFLASVDAGRWPRRDARSRAETILGVESSS